MNAPKEATARLIAFTDALERMADRRDELEARLWLASQFSLDAKEAGSVSFIAGMSNG